MVIDRELVMHVARTTGLNEADAERVIGDVLAYHSVSIGDLVRQRHKQLRLRGVRNNQAFVSIEAELPECVVGAPHLTQRQIRRVIYG